MIQYSRVCYDIKAVYYLKGIGDYGDDMVMINVTMMMMMLYFLLQAVHWRAQEQRHQVNTDTSHLRQVKGN